MSVISGSPRVFRDKKAVLAESIVWDAAHRTLHWCDITTGALHSSPLDGAADGSDDTVVRMPPPLASFHRSEGGGFVVSLGDRVVLADEAGAITSVLAEIDHRGAALRLNEGKVDPAGRWVTGSMNLASSDPTGAIYTVTEDGASILNAGFGVANGFEWSLDDTEMFFTDTATSTIYRAPYTANGELGDVKVFHSGEAHDGLTIDAEGHLWSGIYGRGRVIRYSPDGREEEVLELPVPNITSVAFGGDDLSTLFIGSARENLTEEDLIAHPLSGAVFAVDTTTHGRHPNSFGWLGGKRKETA